MVDEPDVCFVASSNRLFHMKIGLNIKLISTNVVYCDFIELTIARPRSIAISQKTKADLLA